MWGGRDRLTADARIVSATNRDLEAMADSGAFRPDLFYRLNEIPLSLPPLRDRKADLPELVCRLLESCNAENTGKVRDISDEALERILAYEWPGNIRQLQSVLNRAASLCRSGVIVPRHLEALQETPPSHRVDTVKTLNDVECDYISEVLEIAGWNRGRACELLGITRPTLRRKMRHYGLAKTA